MTAEGPKVGGLGGACRDSWKAGEYGTPQYMAPEYLAARGIGTGGQVFPYARYSSGKGDIFALGCVLLWKSTS